MNFFDKLIKNPNLKKNALGREWGGVCWRGVGGGVGVGISDFFIKIPNLKKKLGGGWWWGLREFLNWKIGGGGGGVSE